MGLDDHARDPEPEPEAAVVAGGREACEPLEQPGVVFGLDAWAAIGDHDAGAAVVAVDDDVDRLARAVLDRVRQQVRHDLLDAEAIPARGHGAADLDPDRATRRRRRLLEAIGNAGHERPDLELVAVQRQAPLRDA